MSASNKTIVLRGDLSPNRHKEYPADAALKPGHLVSVNSTSEVLKHATAGGWARRLFAKENGITGDGILQAYAAADIVPCHDALPGDVINARVAAGALALSVGDPVISAGDGTVQKGLATSNVLYQSVADSTPITNTSTITAFDVSYTIPARLLRAGDKIIISGHVLATVQSGATWVITLKIGTTAVLVSGTIVAATNDICYFYAEVTVRTVGASGTIVASGHSVIGTPAAAASAADIPSAYNLLSTAINTLATQAVTVSQTWSTTSNNSNTLKDLTVSILRSAGDNNFIGIAEEAVDNSAGSDEAFCAITVI